jgi:phytoene synthase
MTAFLTVSEPTRHKCSSDARKTLAHHGKSFNWATHFFSRETAADVAILYAFCRQVDDIADHANPEEANQFIGRIDTDLKADHSRLALIGAFIDLRRRYQIDPRIPELLVDTIRRDIGPVQIKRWDQLIRYAYGVASTVGLMMCSIMGVRRQLALPFAIDLGIAMQLTNIARDVFEDAQQNRIYIPAEMLDQDINAPRIVEDLSVVPAVCRARQVLLGRAAEYYRSADLGMRYIPFRPRLAVLTAARLYEAIGRRILTGSVSWGDRAFIDKKGKAKETLGAIGSFLFNPKFRDTGKDPMHNPDLHGPIRGFPGADAR